MMVRLGVLFLMVALVAALFGFGLAADVSTTSFKVVFFVFLTLAFLSLLGGILQQGKLRDNW